MLVVKPPLLTEGHPFRRPGRPLGFPKMIPQTKKRCRETLEGDSMAQPSGFERQGPRSQPAAGVANESGPQANPGYGDGTQSWVWKQYRRLQTGKFQCLHCSGILSGRNSSRMKQHLLNQRVCGFLSSSTAATTDVKLQERVEAANRGKAKIAKQQKQQTLSQAGFYQIPMRSSADKDQLDKLFIRAVIDASLPLSITENESFCAFIRALCPAYKLPSRYEVSLNASIRQLRSDSSGLSAHSHNHCRFVWSNQPHKYRAFNFIANVPLKLKIAPCTAAGDAFVVWALC